MSNVSVANSDAALSGKNIDLLESDQTFTGLKTFSRGAAAPFACAAGSTNVANLDADKVDGKHSTDLLLLDGTQSMSAALNLGTTGQLIFPASQNSSAGANTLDDYEEGTWTPTDGSGAGLTFTTDSSLYVKVGQLVVACCNITYPVTANGSQARINGLPFTTQNTASAVYGCTVNYNGSATGNMYWNVQANATHALAYTLSGTSITNANLSGATIRLTFIYRAAA